MFKLNESDKIVREIREALSEVTKNYLLQKHEEGHSSDMLLPSVIVGLAYAISDLMVNHYGMLKAEKYLRRTLNMEESMKVFSNISPSDCPEAKQVFTFILTKNIELAERVGD